MQSGKRKQAILRALRKWAKKWKSNTETQHSKCEKEQVCNQEGRKHTFLQSLSTCSREWNKVTKRIHINGCKNAEIQTVREITSITASSNKGVMKQKKIRKGYTVSMKKCNNANSKKENKLISKL